MKDENLRVAMSAKHAEFLKKLVEVAKQTGSTAVRVTTCSGSGGSTEYLLWNTRADASEHLRIEEKVDWVLGSPVLDLQTRGYVLHREPDYVTLNYELAKQRVRYEEGGRIGKWWMRTTSNWGHLALNAAAVLGGVWAVCDIVRMIIEALK